MNDSILSSIVLATASAADITAASANATKYPGEATTVSAPVTLDAVFAINRLCVESATVRNATYAGNVSILLSPGYSTVILLA